MTDIKLKLGLLVAFEGIDGAGKTTQAKNCYEYLTKKGYPCVLLKEPTDGEIGKKIRLLAQSGRENISPLDEFNLFKKDREEDVRLNINPALEQNKIVLMDRYYYSSIAYQGALGLDPKFIKFENEKIAPRPQRVYYLSIPAELAVQRITKSRGDLINLFEREEYLNKVKEMFDSMKYLEIKKIDGSPDEESIKENILNDLIELITPLILK
jgi:dTMP kinase